MKIRPLGLSDAFSQKGHGYASFLIEFDDQYILVDCPPDILFRLRQLGLNALDIRYLLITHHHNDHVGGLITFLEFQKYSRLYFNNFLTGDYVREQQEMIPFSVIYCGGDQDWFTHFQRSLELNILDDFNFELLFQSPSDLSLTIFDGRLHVDMKQTKHVIACSALRFNDLIAISADTVFDSNLIQWLAKARIIFHECGMAGPHTKLGDLLSLPEKVKSRMCLYHIPDYFLNLWSHDLPLISIASLRWYEEGVDF